jgi:hypothetical protein
VSAKNLRRASKALQTLPQRVVTDATRRVAKATTGSVTADSGGDRRLSGAGGRGQLRPTTPISGTNVVIGEVTAGPGRARAQWFWLNEGTKARRQGRGRHPGTPAKRTWTRAIDQVMPTIRDEIPRTFHRAVQGRN